MSPDAMLRLDALRQDNVGQARAHVRWLAPYGQLTYPIYLWHGLMVPAVLNGVADKYLRLSGWPMAGFGIMNHALIVFVSYLSCHLLEDPARLSRRPSSAHRRAPAYNRSLTQAARARAWSPGKGITCFPPWQVWAAAR